VDRRFTPLSPEDQREFGASNRAEQHPHRSPDVPRTGGTNILGLVPSEIFTNLDLAPFPEVGHFPHREDPDRAAGGAWAVGFISLAIRVFTFGEILRQVMTSPPINWLLDPAAP
jgi:hypothetical protein